MDTGKHIGGIRIKVNFWEMQDGRIIWEAGSDGAFGSGEMAKDEWEDLRKSWGCNYDDN